jgi:hypothetical protein
MSSPPLKPPALVRWLSILIVVVALVVRFWPHGAAVPQPGAAVPPAPGGAPAAVRTSGREFGESVGFRSRERLEEHFQKHGREFSAATAEDYLHLAQALRDRPVGGDVRELVRPDGVVSRFDRASGAFLAFGPDGVIRTFFRPNDGERYFERQASRPHDGP